MQHAGALSFSELSLHFQRDFTGTPARQGSSGEGGALFLQTGRLRLRPINSGMTGGQGWNPDYSS